MNILKQSTNHMTGGEKEILYSVEWITLTPSLKSTKFSPNSLKPKRKRETQNEEKERKRKSSHNNCEWLTNSSHLGQVDAGLFSECLGESHVTLGEEVQNTHVFPLPCLGLFHASLQATLTLTGLGCGGVGKRGSAQMRLSDMRTYCK